MTDRKIMDEWPGNEPRGGKDGWRRGNARGLHLQQIVEPGDEEVYSGIGTELQAERQRQKLSLAEIANALRIQQAHLLALEEGRTDDLPGPTYAIGFLRTYSEFLNLDGDEVIRQFKREATFVSVERRLALPEPLDEARRPGLRLALVSLLVAGTVYGGWIFLERQGLLPIEVVAEPPERLVPYQTATDTAATADKKNAADPSATQPASTPAHEAVADNTISNSISTATPNIGPVANTVDTGTEEPQASESDPKIANADTRAPEVAPDATPEATAEVADGTRPIEPAQSAPPLVAEEAVGQTAITAIPGPGEGGRAAAPDVSGPVNTAEMPVSASMAATADSSAAPVSPDAMVRTGKPAPEDPTGPALAVDDSVRAQSVAPEPAAPLPDAGGVDAVPAMPLVQTAIDPPPAPAAPSASVRSLTQGAREDASNSDANGTFKAAVPVGLSYRPQVYGASNRDVRVVLRARAESWVQVQGANNELLLTRMLRAGDSYHAPNRDDLILMTGNAGAIEVMVDGVSIGALGPIGQVRRDIRLSADSLHVELRPTSDSSP
ncbi:MAG: DUF4115 domain-containing protein [Proteobacteria bacterium]|nr:DUF4115 domain-containing protein [Pseudomonadota bacterium]